MNNDVGFWLSRTGAYMSKREGLSLEEIKFLRGLEPGNRLVIYTNDTENSNRPELTMKKAKQFY